MGIGNAIASMRNDTSSVSAEKILEGLNPEQREVATHDKGPLLAVAVAGAGKTASIVSRMAYLVKVLGIDPGRILAVTFSKKGAEEMNDRLEKKIGESEARVGTFHSLGYEIVRRENAEFADWKVDDTDRYRICIKDAVGFRELNWKAADASYIANFIGFCKANLARPNTTAAMAIASEFYRKSPKAHNMPRRVNEAYEVAERLRRDRRLLTFDDMLMDSVEMLRDDAGIRARWASKWDYVIQDEAQDQNLAQLMMGELLAQEHRNYCLVGDPAQTIYTWRGAQPDKLLGFEQKWDAKVVRMGRNYRCGSTIIDAANRSLDAMDPAQRLPISMIAERGTVGEVITKVYQDLDVEGSEVAQRVLNMVTDGKKYSDFAVLYRTNAQSRAVEEAMLSNRIPYKVIGGANFYDRREVRSLLSYLRLAEGRGEIDDIERCINSPFRFLGRAFIEKVTEAARIVMRTTKCVDVSWTDLVRNVANREGIQTRQKESAYEWADLIEFTGKKIRIAMEPDQMQEQKDLGKPAKLLEDIVLATRYTAWLERDEGEETTENSRVSNVRELIRAAGRFPTVKELLDYIDNVGKRSKKARKDDQPNKVILTTIHRSKGLEWPVVFLVGVSEGILPHARCEDEEEERRLFYVGVTRARDTLHVSAVLNVTMGSRVIMTEPSSFISEAGLIPQAHLATGDLRHHDEDSVTGVDDGEDYDDDVEG